MGEVKKGHIFLLAILALFARLILSACSYGTNDVSTWQYFAEQINSHGLAQLYHKEQGFNHPPLAGLLVAALARLSLWLGVPFPFMLRVPGLLAEFISAAIIWNLWRERSSRLQADNMLLIFSLSLVSILVSSYHGNTDCLYALAVLLAAVLIERRRAFFFAGLALGLGINIKLIPLLLIIPLASRARSLRDLLLFGSGLSICALPFLGALLLVGQDFVRNVFQYNSQLDLWGFEILLLPSQGAALSDLALDFHLRYGRYLILFAIALLCASPRIRRSCDTFELSALSFALFAIFAPGFGMQYFVVLPPLLLCFSGFWGWLLPLLTGLAALTSYLGFMVSWWPLKSVHNSLASPVAAFASLVCWLALIAFMFLRLRCKATAKMQ